MYAFVLSVIHNTSFFFNLFLEWDIVCRSTVQKSICRTNIHSTQQPIETTEHSQKIWYANRIHNMYICIFIQCVAGALAGNVKGKRVILIDDSIVRGNTIGPIIKLLKNAGATEVHIRVASPPLKYPCYMGINIPTREELIANKMNSKELARHVGEYHLSAHEFQFLQAFHILAIHYVHIIEYEHL